MHHSGIACIGTNDARSMLLHHIHNIIGSGIKEIYLLSDDCPVQNENNAMIRFLLDLTDTELSDEIYHFFQIRGHSFLLNDIDFRFIKNCRKTRLYMQSNSVIT